MSRYIDADKILKKIESRIGYFNQYYPDLIENIGELEICEEFINDEIKHQSEVKRMNGRNCENCKHHTENGCTSWECEYEPKNTAK